MADNQVTILRQCLSQPEVQLGSSKRDNQNLQELKAQIDKIQQIKKQYQSQKQQINDLQNIVISPRNKNMKMNETSTLNKYKYKHGCDMNISSKSERKPILNDSREKYLSDNIIDKIKMDEADKDINCEYEANKAKFLKDQNNKQNQQEQIESPICPDVHCQYKAYRQKKYGFIRNSQSAINLKSATDGYQKQNEDRSFHKFHTHHNVDPKHYLLQNFVGELRSQLNQKNKQLTQQKQRQLQYKNYLMICNQQNEKLTQMNIKLKESQVQLHHQNTELREQLNKQIKDKYMLDYKYKDIGAKMLKTFEKWNNQFEKMDSFYKNFEDIVSKTNSITLMKK